MKKHFAQQSSTKKEKKSFSVLPGVEEIEERRKKRNQSHFALFKSEFFALKARKLP